MKTKKAVSVLLSLLVLLSVFASASLIANADSDTVYVKNWSELKSALEDGKDGTVIVSSAIQTEVPTTDRVVINGGNKTLDLKDNTIRITTTGDIAFCNLFTINGGSLKIKGFGYIRYTYNISQEYLDSKKPSAICYVNGGNLDLENCELHSITGAAVKINSGYSCIGMGTTLKAEGNWALTDTSSCDGKISVCEDAFVCTSNGGGTCSQGAHEGYGALRLESENTTLTVTEASFDGGVQLKSEKQTAQFTYKYGEKALFINGSEVSYKLKTDKYEAQQNGDKYFWYTYGGVYYYLGEVENGSNSPGVIRVEDALRSENSVTIENSSKAFCYGGYQKSGKARDTAAAGRELYLIAESKDTEFVKWVLVSGDAVIADPANSTTKFIMGEKDVVISAVYKDTSLDGKIISVDITGVEAPKAGNTPSTAASVPENADYAVYVEYGNPLVNWWQGNTMVTESFESGVAYEVRVFLVPKDGCAFVEDVTATLNGNPAYYWHKGDSLIVGYTFPETPETGTDEPVTAPVTEPVPVSDFTYIVNGDTVEITGYNGLDKEIVIPSEIDGKKVTSIAESAFEETDIISVVIPETVTSIGKWAFGNCKSLEFVKIDGALEVIEPNTFNGCSSLESVNIPDTVKSIGYYAFAGCSNLSSLIVPPSVTYIEGHAFGFYYDGESDSHIKYDNFKIIGEKGSEAERYAEENGIKFEEKSFEPAETTAPVIPTQPVTSQVTPTQPVTALPDFTEPKENNGSKITVKKSNPVTVKAKTKKIKAKKVKKKKTTVKPLIIKNAKGTVTVTKVKKGTTSKIYKKIKVNKKTGAVTFKKGKYKKKTYKVRLKIIAKGNSEYKSKTIYKTVKIKVN